MPIKIKVPLHITGFWKPVYTSNDLYTGSIGAGVNITQYLALIARKSKEKVFRLNNKVLTIKTLENLYPLLRHGVEVDAHTSAPLGAGYGLSAAIALGLSLASTIINKERITLEDAAARAHIAEVRAGTGLGDVIAEYYGGLEVRVKPGPPGIGCVVKIPVDPMIRVVTVPLGRMDTSLMLQKYSSRHARIAIECVRELLRNPSLESFIELSNRFSRQFFDYRHADNLLAPLHRYLIGYYVKKRVLTIFVERDRLGDIEDYLRDKGYNVLSGRIDYSGVRIEDTA